MSLPPWPRTRAASRWKGALRFEARKRTDSIATHKTAILADDGNGNAPLMALREELDAKGTRCEVVSK